MAITKDMSIIEIVQTYPDTVEILMNAGMGCLGCAQRVHRRDGNSAVSTERDRGHETRLGFMPSVYLNDDEQLQNAQAKLVLWVEYGPSRGRQ